MCLQGFIKGNCLSATGLLTMVRDTATTDICDKIAADRTFVTGNVNDLDNILMEFVAANGEFDAL